VPIADFRACKAILAELFFLGGAILMRKDDLMRPEMHHSLFPTLGYMPVYHPSYIMDDQALTLNVVPIRVELLNESCLV
jgi:hypothetical protein